VKARSRGFLKSSSSFFIRKEKIGGYCARLDGKKRAIFVKI
jgi:hypothetical protein